MAPSKTNAGAALVEHQTRSKRSRRKQSISSQVLMSVAECKYDVVREAARTLGWKLVDGETETSRKCHIYWVDVANIIERLQHLRPWQRINHFPGMSNVARKGRMAQNLDRMRRAFPQDYSFYPRTWVLPSEWGSFKAEFDSLGKSTRTFIIKPDSGCQGRGIYLTQDLERVNAMESQVAQVYVRKPLLIDGLKFDLRLYVLVTSVIPFRVYAFKDGLVRFCTEEYLRPTSDNLGERCMHLTNYAVNKWSNNFVANTAADRDDLGSKRSLRWLLDWVTREHGEEKAGALWRRMCNSCVKTLLSILPILHREYLQAFGLDARTKAKQKAKPNRREEKDNAEDKEYDNSYASAKKCFGSREGGAPGKGKQDPQQPPQQGDYQPDGANQFHHEQRGDEPGGGSRMDPEDTEGVVEGSRCVEILGVDFMVDSSLKPWLIEVNHLPSFATDSPLDERIKSQVVSTAMSVLKAKAEDKQRYEEAAKRAARLRLYTAAESGSAGSIRGLREQEKKELEAGTAKIRSKLEDMYQKFAPHKLSKVDALLCKYAGRERKLLKMVYHKYASTGCPGDDGNAPGSCHSSKGSPVTAPAHGSGRTGSCISAGSCSSHLSSLPSA
ncbi:unnamed protein product, partial [Discosporangium mesarthrocarpum]